MDNNTATKIEVFFGDWITDPNEERFLNKLVRDLAQRGIDVSIFANVQARGNSGQRQIDFFVLTSHRLAHVELKSLSQTAPLRGGENGNWRQLFDDGRTRSLGGNPYRQAHDGTYALSDVITRRGSRLGLSTPAPFYGSIDTVVCIDPDIPRGSVLDPYRYVKAVGYDELLDRLGTRGPRPEGWTFDDWRVLPATWA